MWLAFLYSSIHQLAMITDARALRPEQVPQDLHHREGQIDHLSTVLDSTGTARSEDVCIFGPSGAGKTTIAKHTLGLLEREALHVRWGYVNCMSESTPSAALHRLLRDAGIGADLRREGTHKAAAIDRLRECDEQVICVIDEVDVLDDPSLLLSLYQIPNVAQILITTKQDEWLAEVGTRAESRFRSAESIQLEKYSHRELVDILDARVVHGLISARVADNAVAHIADLAAGDARQGIVLLRRAAHYVEKNDVRELTAEVVDGIVKDAEADLRDRRIRSLGTHKRLLYEIVREAGSLDSGTLHARYEDRSLSPKARSTRRKYLKSLRRYDLIASEGTGRSTMYQHVEPDGTIRSAAAPAE